MKDTWKLFLWNWLGDINILPPIILQLGITVTINHGNINILIIYIGLNELQWYGLGEFISGPGSKQGLLVAEQTQNMYVQSQVVFV